MSIFPPELITDMNKCGNRGGYLYIVTNPSHKGWVKIGVTEDIKSRLRTYQTSDPKRAYKIEYYIFHPDAYAAEKKIKEMMHYFALAQRNEWYECAVAVARVRLDETLEDIREI